MYPLVETPTTPALFVWAREMIFARLRSMRQQKKRKSRIDRKALAALSDHLLKDIGCDRFELTNRE